ncbi:MAG: hypothetical protein IH955_04290, partial [Chloroflexi bacterium]|nr:hypothetical protein [Chloroflexota bacterium]
MVSKILSDFYEDLPTPIQSEFHSDSEFMASMGIKLLETVLIEDLSFEATSFWRAMTEAINERDSMIAPIGTDNNVVFHPFKHSNGRRLFHFKHPTTGKKIVGSNEFLDLLIESPSQREAALRRHRDWFDCPSSSFEQAIAEIVGIADPSARIAKADGWRSSSITLFYKSLQEQLQGSGGAGSKDLMPHNPEALFGYYRLTPDVGQSTTFSYATERAAETLLREEG